MRQTFSEMIEHERTLYSRLGATRRAAPEPPALGLQLPRVLVDGKGRPLVTDAETFVSVGRPLEGLAPTVYEMAVRAMNPKMPDVPADTPMIFYRPLWPFDEIGRGTLARVAAPVVAPANRG